MSYLNVYDRNKEKICREFYLKISNYFFIMKKKDLDSKNPTEN